MSRWLASVRSLTEVSLLLVAPSGLPDIIDLKEPRQGALGALPVATVREAVALVKGRCQTSATIGDLPMEPAQIRRAAEKMAATGVDYVKIGLFTDGRVSDCLIALQPLAVQGIPLVGVMFADRQPNFSWISLMRQVGFKGAMLDTSVKEGRSLLSYLSLAVIADFIEAARNAGLVSGLAGSLSAEDIPLLLPLEPNYLGFRSALCRAGRRGSSLDLEAISLLKSALQEKGTRGEIQRETA
jgi:(5-formylfuran-3-yl)methyl phosphate synthase